MQDNLSSSRVVARSAVFNAVGYAVAVLYAFVVIPLILHFLGTEKFGVWSLAVALTGYIGLADLGMTFSIVKYIAEYAAQGDQGKMNSVIRHGVLFYGLSAVVFMLIGLLVRSRQELVADPLSSRCGEKRLGHGTIRPNSEQVRGPGDRRR